MRYIRRRIMAACAGAAMLVNATYATASPAAQPPTKAATSNPWVTLSMLNPAGAAALGSTAAAAQSESMEGPSGIPWAVWAMWAAVILFDVYLILKDDDDDDDEPEVVTPD